MSASLVGSEMCIRDRREPLTATGCSESALKATRNTTNVELPLRPVVTPVSYTHLTLPTICSV
eukprot:2857190-Alexandrium_andersonii.AAC.1